MSLHCRTCGEPIFHINPRNLFTQENEEIRQNIYAITGLRLFFDRQMPSHICSCCYLDLNHAMAFRERCIEAAKQLTKLKQEATAARKDIYSSYQQIDPLDDHNPSKSVESRLHEELVEDLQSEGLASEDSPKKTKHRSTEPRRVMDSNHLSPRVFIKRCRDPSEDLAKRRPESPVKRNCFNSTTQCSVKPKFVLRSTGTGEKTVFVRSAELKHRSDDNREKTRRVRKTSSTEKKYVCDQCGWSFRDLSNMKDHALRHSGIKKFECEECSRKFFTRPLLMLHVRVHHKGERPFVCKYCGMAFPNSPSRCRHERKFHANELPFKCNICSRTFISKISLDKHKIAHVNGEATPRCETCKKTFKGPTYLKNHYLTKFHLRRVNQGDRNYSDSSDTNSDGEIDFDFADSFIEELDE